ncbi:MAG TPA: methylated-DNA--[protein]-cysteine S-methyltransferase [Candidatus Limnocylindria bacterium]|nr:methylated-DNA--[protein]-cysteine S-methyltransferase [Candidatus Limnocylindria bacterium]
MTSPTRRALALDVAVLPSPVGPLVVITAAGVVVASGFGTVAQVVQLLPAELADLDRHLEADLGPIAEAVRAYTAGDLAALDLVPVEQPGGPFLVEAWRVMRDIPAGETWSYAELATKAGRPAAVRAAGQACAQNRVAPFVPCHRVVRSDGSLGGYAYSLPTKRALLDFEAGQSALSAPS